MKPTGRLLPHLSGASGCLNFEAAPPAAPLAFIALRNPYCPDCSLPREEAPERLGSCHRHRSSSLLTHDPVLRNNLQLEVTAASVTKTDRFTCVRKEFLSSGKSASRGTSSSQCSSTDICKELHHSTPAARGPRCHALMPAPSAAGTPAEVRRSLWDVSVCLSVLPVAPSQLLAFEAGAADVGSASGTRLSLLFLAVSFPLGPPDRFWLMSKLLQLFVGVTFAEAD
ncbi:unnamed protein product [Pleuronectes platessa]|uniref:Uncharacterized protein n=1 Tax=Pleuronectes platessa TaxID=8262 RepID=A0A9N7V954_PLEPL|nr:unnamed protein product [Pleuronectes platessa]